MINQIVLKYQWKWKMQLKNLLNLTVFNNSLFSLNNMTIAQKSLRSFNMLMLRSFPLLKKCLCCKLRSFKFPVVSYCTHNTNSHKKQFVFWLHCVSIGISREKTKGGKSEKKEVMKLWNSKTSYRRTIAFGPWNSLTLGLSH